MKTVVFLVMMVFASGVWSQAPGPAPEPDTEPIKSLFYSGDWICLKGPNDLTLRTMSNGEIIGDRTNCQQDSRYEFVNIGGSEYAIRGVTSGYYWTCFNNRTIQGRKEIIQESKLWIYKDEKTNVLTIRSSVWPEHYVYQRYDGDLLCQRDPDKYWLRTGFTYYAPATK